MAENDELRTRVDELERELLRLRGVQGEFLRLGEAVGYARRSGGPLRVADVVYADYTSWLRSMLLWVGEGGAQRNQPVIGARGLVGRVVTTGGAYAKVQLVTDRTRLFDFGKGLRYTAETVREKFGVRPDQMTDFLGLAGDAVDNIPGVKGIGAGSAAELLAHFESLEDLYARLDELPRLPVRGAKSLHAKLAAARETALLSKRLATVERHVPGLEGAFANLEFHGAEPRIDELFLRLGFNRIRERVPLRA